MLDRKPSQNRSLVAAMTLVCIVECGSKTLANTPGGELDVEDAGTDTLPADILTPAYPGPGTERSVSWASNREAYKFVVADQGLLPGTWRCSKAAGDS